MKNVHIDHEQIDQFDFRKIKTYKHMLQCNIIKIKCKKNHRTSSWMFNAYKQTCTYICTYTFAFHFIFLDLYFILVHSPLSNVATFTGYFTKLLCLRGEDAFDRSLGDTGWNINLICIAPLANPIQSCLIIFKNLHLINSPQIESEVTLCRAGPPLNSCTKSKTVNLITR